MQYDLYLVEGALLDAVRIRFQAECFFLKCMCVCVLPFILLPEQEDE